MNKIEFTVFLRDKSNNFVKKGLLSDIIINDNKKLSDISSIQISKLIEDNDKIYEVPYILIYNNQNTLFIRKSMLNIENTCLYVFESLDSKEMFDLYKKVIENIQCVKRESILSKIKVKK